MLSETGKKFRLQVKRNFSRPFHQSENNPVPETFIISKILILHLNNCSSKKQRRMKLSVIIVNYNVENFLEQCLNSVLIAAKGIESEIFVVDNNSVDGSVHMVKEKFPSVILIENKDNKGFSKANNQAIRQSSGEFILLLNPDTVIEDDTFKKIVSFMDEHPDAGGLGVKMVDGKGLFLPESKRGLPTPEVAFYKIFGFSYLFPRSRVFGRYHLGYLDNDKIHKIDILSGAFMLLRKEVLQITGLLDESFFMYGEDIDLSYRIIKAGYNNYYYPETTIIHYKGESTKKTSVNYVLTFYRAMIIFASRHFSPKNARLFSLLINMAVLFRAGIAIIHRIVNALTLPILDFGLIYTGFYLIKEYWEKFVLHNPEYYPSVYHWLVIPIYITVWIISVFLSAGYEKPVKIRKIIQGIVTGTLIILVFYALLPELYRFSRALILFGALWALFSSTGLRLILHLTGIKKFRIGMPYNKRFIIIGSNSESERVADILNKANRHTEFVGKVRIDADSKEENGFLGDLTQIKDIILIYRIEEIIFCAKDLPSGQIISLMTELQHTQVDYKIAPPESYYLIGSNSINSPGDLFVLHVNAISKTINKRNKRLFDIAASIIMMILFPVIIFIVKKPYGLIMNIVAVLQGKYSWIGYCQSGDVKDERLPEIKMGILNPTDVLNNSGLTEEFINNLNIVYARDYHLLNDINIFIRGFRKLGLTKKK